VTNINTKRAVVHAVVPAELLEQFKRVAVAEDRSLSAQLRKAIAEHIDQRERSERER
jgi:CopG-like RHH_1 or ribbon-helix-helix domain, RHH_5